MTLQTNFAEMGKHFTVRPALLPRWAASLRALVGGRQRDSLARHEPTVEQAASADAELRRLKDLADEATRAKVEFLATINHELRTPLNAVLGFSELLEREVFGPLGHPRYLEYAHLIRVSGDHLLRVITEILDISRNGAGLMDLELRPVELDQIVTNCCDLLAARAGTAGVEIIVEPSTAPTILADPARIQHALLNLLSNAIKFSRHGSHVMIALSSRSLGAEIVISDSGIGMSSEELLLALEPFRQVDSTMRRRHEGMGLGLPVAKRLIEMHGGTLRIDSAPGYGTSVKIILPTKPNRPPQTPEH
jgi:signal transduction histidine kinase